MSWITSIWSMEAAACLTLAVMHLVIWLLLSIRIASPPLNCGFCARKAARNAKYK